MQIMERPSVDGLEMDPGAPGRAALEAADRAQAAIEELFNLMGTVSDPEDTILLMDRMSDLNALLKMTVCCDNCCQTFCANNSNFAVCYQNCRIYCMKDLNDCGVGCSAGNNPSRLP